MPTLLKIIGVLFLIGLASLSAVTVHATYLSKCSESWPKAEGTIKESEVRSNDDAGETKYKAHVLYEFSVEGKKYSSSNITYSLYSSSKLNDVEQVVLRYPKGQTVSVHYQPDDPGESVLEPGLVQWMVPVSIVLCLISTGVPLVLLIHWLRRRKG